jgi:hypothetical protein
LDPELVLFPLNTFTVAVDWRMDEKEEKNEKEEVTLSWTEGEWRKGSRKEKGKIEKYVLRARQQED